eukprot:TRINITY_DN21019_c0_g1_i1.p1 TRINITY_DN21019_c0_g1~~TRINITY_DN21019_c0_g1_i1.p1  ORF type:complete len:377 (+),score=73.44 TRINITY_DN21019_c0_g1_i1:48-1133(+)
MSTLWGDVNELPPPCSTTASKPEVFLDILGVDPANGGAAAMMEKYREDTSLSPGALVLINKTGETGIVLEVFTTYIKLVSGEACSRHGVTLLCGKLRIGSEPKQLQKDLKIAEGVVSELKKKGVIVFDELLVEKDRIRAAEAIKDLSFELDFNVAGTGQGEAHKRDGRLRGDLTTWLAKDGSLPPTVQYILDKMNRLRRGIASVTKKPLPRSSFQLAKYTSSGVGYVSHRDVRLDAPQDNKRRLTCIYYCNEDWDASKGGCLELYPNSGLTQHVESRSDSAETLSEKQKKKFSKPIRIEPRSGKLVIFNSSLIHRVLPEHFERYAITCWMSGPESLGLQHPSSEFDIDTHFTGDESIFPSR